MWCDFVIYTLKGRVNRDEQFWNIIYLMLKHFYYFYMIPSLNHIALLQNGLADDPADYKNLLNSRGYLVCKYQRLDKNMPDIFVDDFVTLNGN